jgi:hypothetical protein
LHTLEPAGDSLAATHIPDCPICTSNATQTEDLGATLGLSVPQTIPSAELDQRVLGVTSAQRESAGHGTDTPDPANTTHHQAIPAPRQRLAIATTATRLTTAARSGSPLPVYARPAVCQPRCQHRTGRKHQTIRQLLSRDCGATPPDNGQDRERAQLGCVGPGPAWTE